MVGAGQRGWKWAGRTTLLAGQPRCDQALRQGGLRAVGGRGMQQGSSIQSQQCWGGIGADGWASGIRWLGRSGGRGVVVSEGEEEESGCGGGDGDDGGAAEQGWLGCKRQGSMGVDGHGGSSQTRHFCCRQ